MKSFILKSLEQIAPLGYVVVIGICAVIGLDRGLFGSGFLGLIAGLMVGVLLATLIFGLAILLLGIYRNTTYQLLLQRHGAEEAERLMWRAERATGIFSLPAKELMKIATSGYLILFFMYMFLPLLFMVVAAFNTVAVPPTAIPFEGFTFAWFGELFTNAPLWLSVVNSLIIGAGVIVLSLGLGLAGALLITRLQSGSRTLIYGVLVSPLLTPGIILGISTLVFWNGLGIGGGLFVATLAQSTFISAYCMLMFIARLQRFDPVLEEAALDLGASHQQVFRSITMPFLKPTLLTAGVIAFLQSFENFNTTVFAIGTETTLTIKLAALARKTPTPEVNALAFIFIALTIVIAVVYELKRRAEKAREEVMAERAKRADAEMTLEKTALAEGKAHDDDGLAPQAQAQPA